LLATRYHKIFLKMMVAKILRSNFKLLKYLIATLYARPAKIRFGALIAAADIIWKVTLKLQIKDVS
jgi:hypothetical protein